MTIRSVIVVNDAGQPRLVRWYESISSPTFYTPVNEETDYSSLQNARRDRGGGGGGLLADDEDDAKRRTNLLKRIYLSVSRRPESSCNFFDSNLGWGRGTKIIYRHYATLYFIFVCEETESELGILDLIQVFVETLDRVFESVCELDLIFHADRVHQILDEVIQGGMVLETNITHVLKATDDMAKLERAQQHNGRGGGINSGGGFQSSSVTSRLPGFGNTVPVHTSSSSQTSFGGYTAADAGAMGAQIATQAGALVTTLTPIVATTVANAASVASTAASALVEKWRSSSSSSSSYR